MARSLSSRVILSLCAMPFPLRHPELAKSLPSTPIEGSLSAEHSGGGWLGCCAWTWEILRPGGSG